MSDALIWKNEDVDQDLEDAIEDGRQILHLNYRHLNQFPPKLVSEAEKYEQVTRIYLKRNGLKLLPNAIDSLKNVVELYLHSNLLEKLPDAIGNMQKLQSLDVGNNKLKHLPSTIGDLQSLESLHLSNNFIQNLPNEIGKLHNLLTLEVMNNQLYTFNREICHCKKLQHLLLDRNKLKWLPNDIHNLQSLQELSVVGNELLCVPLSLGSIASLKSVYVDNNPYLHAMPVGIDHVELGFSSCGSENFQAGESMGDCYKFIKIKHGDEEWKHIYFPSQVKAMGDRDTCSVPTLLELGMRTVHKHFDTEEIKCELPVNLYNTLQCPVTACYCCNTPIFTMGFPMVFEGQIRIYSLYRVVLVCSAKCLKLAFSMIPLPLIYPTPTAMNVAVAVVL